jgi:hypothetical protein
MTLKDTAKKAFSGLEYIACVATFQAVYVHELYHYVMAKIVGFTPELRLLDGTHEKGFMAYTKVTYDDSEPEYKVILLYAAPFLFGFPLAFIANHLPYREYVAPFIMLTVFMGLADAVYIGSCVGKMIRKARNVST